MLMTRSRSKQGLFQANLDTWSPYRFSIYCERHVPVPLLGHRASCESEKAFLGKITSFQYSVTSDMENSSENEPGSPFVFTGYW